MSAGWPEATPVPKADWKDRTVFFFGRGEGCFLLLSWGLSSPSLRILASPGRIADSPSQNLLVTLCLRRILITAAFLFVVSCPHQELRA